MKEVNFVSALSRDSDALTVFICANEVRRQPGLLSAAAAAAHRIAISIAMQRRSSPPASRVFRELSEGFLKFRMPAERSIKFFKWISSYFRPRIKELHGSPDE